MCSAVACDISKIHDEPQWCTAESIVYYSKVVCMTTMLSAEIYNWRMKRFDCYRLFYALWWGKPHHQRTPLKLYRTFWFTCISWWQLLSLAFLGDNFSGEPRSFPRRRAGIGKDGFSNWICKCSLTSSVHYSRWSNNEYLVTITRETCRYIDRTCVFPR